MTPSRNHSPAPWATAAGVALAVALGVATPARADGPRMPASIPKAYTQECAACHTAYPPGLLPEASWARVMGGLEHHFGVDASLDMATLQQLNGWLQAHAATQGGASQAPPEDRITRSAWFERKHRQIDKAVWKLPSVKSAAQCATCHTRADRGSFDDEHLREPAGLSAAQRRAWRD